ncbi:NAD-dependent epimerase/dehydratase family protein [Candidatus Halobonum tyrrellensis]|uniref:UDP-glucose 4-epimerase n=1 Tax=Candidatus Halobonum tyrrellensis G22 TaxID=1324957 RepID=V4HPL3_9EURY|nr:NAD(P)-dependent oxidoreductase [Candidatus Halobonum tyrrellensis]ESP89834.1 UDP-glucose 4-epimerase [Candidatus Halobonum tyrrellensis G22]
MSDVLVTGGLGRLGRWTVDYLLDAGWTVTCVDVDHPGFGRSTRPGVEFRAVDLTNPGETREVIEQTDPEWVVHLAAIPNPEVYAGSHVLENNVMSTYTVLTSAGREGVPVTWASSESAYGFPFAAEPRLPDYLPIDEAHPLRPEDPYGTSKILGEDLAEMVVRKFEVPVVSLRISNVQYPGNYGVVDHQSDLAAGVGNFWSYVDGRDVASAVEATFDAGLDGHEPVVVAADDNYLDRPTVEAVEEMFGDLPERCDLDGEQSALSNAKAADRLGWTPSHTWRSAANEAVAGPTLVTD